MFCPKCGKNIPRGDWRCLHCGSDLRRILKEEFWSKNEDDESSESSGSRFHEEGTLSAIGWRNMHPNRRPAVFFAMAAIIALMLLTLIMYFAMKPSSKKGEGEAASTVAESANTVAAVAESPTSVKKPKPQPVVAEAAGSAAKPAAVTTGPLTQGEVGAFIQNWLAEWRKAIESKNVKSYSSFYSETFRTAAGKDKKSFIAGRSSEAKATYFVNIEMGTPTIQLQGNRATVQFSQTYLSDRLANMGTKTLVVEREGTGVKIVSETFQDATPQPKTSVQTITTTIMNWRKSLEDIAIHKKVGNLASFYHPDFKSQSGKNMSSFVDSKFQFTKKFSILAIDARDIKISVLGDKAIASFQQTFKSDKYGDKGIKILLFKIENGKPLIYREIFVAQGKAEPLKMDDFWGPQ